MNADEFYAAVEDTVGDFSHERLHRAMQILGIGPDDPRYHDVFNESVGSDAYDVHHRMDAVKNYVAELLGVERGPDDETEAQPESEPDGQVNPAERFPALVSIETRVLVDSVVEHAIEREYRTGHLANAQGRHLADTDAAKGARFLALAGIRMDWSAFWVQTNGDDRGLDLAADTHLRTMVDELLAARECQCPRSGMFPNEFAHGHRGQCRAHYESDVPLVNGNRLCGTCYHAEQAKS